MLDVSFQYFLVNNHSEFQNYTSPLVNTPSSLIHFMIASVFPTFQHQVRSCSLSHLAICITNFMNKTLSQTHGHTLIMVSKKFKVQKYLLRIYWEWGKDINLPLGTSSGPFWISLLHLPPFRWKQFTSYILVHTYIHTNIYRKILDQSPVCN